jgi:uncharacterized repeat protein (TIGR02543 family)
MRKWKRNLAGGILCILLTVVATIALNTLKLLPWTWVDASVVNSNGEYTIPGTSSSSLGSDSNPFVVLEIVPNESMAQFGYLVDGQEPINLFTAMTTGTSTEKNAVTTALLNYMTVSLDNNTILKQEFVTGIDNQEWLNYYWNYNVNANQYGYYEKLSDKTGDYDTTLTTKSVTDSVTKVVKTVYEYRIGPVKAGTGSYQWVGLSYADSSSLTNTSTYLGAIESDTPLNASDTLLKKIYGYQQNVAVYNAYKGTKINNELFKKYSLGLIYKDNDFQKGEDSSAYEFVGWYKEPECVNSFNKSENITSNMTLYAKWKTVYSSGTVKQYTVSFDANAGTDLVIHIPANLEFLNLNDSIVEPDGVPLRDGYVFTDWYANAGCTTLYDFTKKITANSTVYAGWSKLTGQTYTISFQANAGVGNDGTVKNLPADVTKVKQNGRTEAFTEVKPLTNPSRTDYIFAGWYWNKACTNPFAFDQTIPASVTTDSIVLYARWILASSATTYKITFNGNKPASAISSISGMPKSVTDIIYGTGIEDGFPADTPSLVGNIVDKLKNYHVKVITVTPKDFTNKDTNLGLIDRANLIVMNETCEDSLKNFWNNYKNTELFSKPTSQYNITATKFTTNDLSWAATLRLMEKITGLGSSSMCPVLYDYNIYESVIASTSTSVRSTVSFTSKFSDSIDFNSGNVYGYSSNVYKLYLMTQQFNPVTLNNKYISTSKIDSLGNFQGVGISGAWTTNAKKYWNNFTMLPYEVISSSAWNSTTKTFASNTLEVIGIDSDYTVPSGKGLIHNRVFLYRGTASLVSGFMVPQLLSADHKDMNNFFYPGSTTLPDRYTTAEGIYYMLHSSGLYQNFSKSINILEIEPCDTFKNSSYWFWYISRYVPNFTGPYNVTQKNSSEFIGDIDDLNSKYDIIYMGADGTSVVTSLMPNSIATSTATANQQITIQTAQTITTAYQKQENVAHTATTYDVRKNNSSGYSFVDGAGKSVVNFSGSTAAITYANIGSDKTWLNLGCSVITTTSPGNNDYRYSYNNSSGQAVTVYFSSISVTSSYSNISATFEDNSNGNISKRINGIWKPGYIVLNDYYFKATTTTTNTAEWVDYPAQTAVAAGDIIRFPGGGSYEYTSGSYYRYAHVGAKATGKTTRRGSFDNQYDNIDQYLYSGNDITRVKLNNLLEFAKAGYPIILSNDFFNSSGNIDTSIIDKSSYVYSLLQSLLTDANYTPSCFKEVDITRDSEFVHALNNKNFNLVIIDKPVEFVDRTIAANKSMKDDQVYINGASDNSNSNIDEKNLDFTIKIDTANTGYYEVRLYIDTNADGKFSETEEKLDSLEIENTATHKTTRVNQLVGGQTYNIVRQIKDYTGAIPWKLEIFDVNNLLIRDDITGQCAIKVATKAKLKVLQIISDGINSNSSYMPTVYFPTAAEIATAKTKNGGKDITDTGVNINTYFTNCIRLVNSGSVYVTDTNVLANAGWFYYYTKILNEFEVEFCRLTVTEFSALATSGTAPGDTKVYMKDGKCTYFTDKGINMLILGYADCYSDITNTKALQLIDNFINAGNTTLFTHDTTSFVNLSSKPGTFDDTYWGYNINQYFRQLLGMDRFGVMDNKGVAANLGTASDRPYKVNTLPTDNSYYTANGTSVGTRVLTQGMTNVTVGQNGDRVTGATKSNDGQIVTYPYMIPDKLTVSSTHSQYYQLDMEADDIVVWYCLDGTSDFYKTNNDVRNNYYIYNRGNITYSGVGHSGGLSDDERKLFVNTMIAAYSAGTVPTEPVITNKDKTTQDSTTSFLYVDYDATLDVGEAKPFGSEISSYSDGSDTVFTKRVYFTLKNYSIILNKKMTVHFYPVITTTTGTVTTKTVLTEYPMSLNTYEYNSDLNTGRLVVNDSFEYSQTYSNSSVHTVNLSGGLVESNYDYYVDIPISDKYYKNLVSGSTDQLENFALDSNNKFEIQIQVVMRYGRDEAKNVPLVGTSNAIFLKRGMFTLD